MPYLDKFGETLHSGGSLAVLRFLVDELTPPCPLDGSVFLAACTATKEVDMNIVNFLLEKQCPLGSPDNQGAAMHNLSRYASIATMIRMRAAGCAVDWRSLAGCFNAVVDDEDDDGDEVEPFPKLKREWDDDEDEFDFDLEKLKFLINGGCSRGSHEQQLALVSVASQYMLRAPLELLCDSGFPSDETIFRDALENGCPLFVLNWLLDKEAPNGASADSTAPKLWCEVSPAFMRKLPQSFSTRFSFRFFSQYREFSAIMQLLGRDGFEPWTSDAATAFVSRITGYSSSPPFPDLVTYFTSAVKSGMILDADLMKTALRGRGLLNGANALRNLDPPCPWNETVLSAADLVAWRWAADAGCPWKGDALCEAFEKLVTSLVDSVHAGTSTLKSVRRQVLAAGAFRYWLLHRAKGCPCGGRRHDDSVERSCATTGPIDWWLESQVILSADAREPKPKKLKASEETNANDALTSSAPSHGPVREMFRVAALPSIFGERTDEHYAKAFKGIKRRDTVAITGFLSKWKGGRP